MSEETRPPLDPLEIVELYLDNQITGGELFDRTLKLCYQRPDDREAVLRAMEMHPDESVRRTGAEVREMIREREERVTDVDTIRKTSPLRPGAPVLLYGGYSTSIERPYWLQGREFRRGTFVDFVPRAPGTMPSALVELEEPIHLGELAGRRYGGRYALLQLHFVSDWTESETVGVHLLDAVPEDVEAFYADNPPGTEVETHAQYRLDRKDF